MKFSEQWLRTWVDPPVTTQGLADQLTMAGLEVEAVTPAAPPFDGVVVGKVIDVEDHPESRHLKACAVDIGRPERLRVVTTAAVRPGLITAVAPAGATLPGGEVTVTSVKGIRSQGVFCAGEVLGLSDGKDTLLNFPPEVAPGTDIRDLLQLHDAVIEIGITPNRGDCLSIAGVAREVAAANDAPLSAQAAPPVAATTDERLGVAIEAPQACPRYVGRVITGIDPRAETPWWLRERLRRSGIRCVSPVVDVTNYVMMELGQPMHAFDLRKIDGGIRVRLAAAGERVTLLDGQEIAVQDLTLVIADHRRVVALAGIMGGRDSAVDEGTTALFLESAFFAPAAVAGQPRRYGLQSESSYRFERGVDPGLPVAAMERATALLLEIVGGAAGPVVETVSEAHLPRPPVVALRGHYVRRTLGTEVDEQWVSQTLARLGMRAERGAEGWRVTPPAHRFDIAIEADLVEELARLYGYDRLPQSRPRQRTVVKAHRPDRLTGRLRTLLADRDYQEVITYSFVDPRLQAMLNPGCSSPRLKNPLSEDLAQMRSNLWPGLVQALQHNAKRQQARIRIFEIAPRYRLESGQVAEDTAVAGLAFGPLYPEQWGSPRRDGDFFDVKADVEALLALCAPEGYFAFEAQSHPALHPGQTAAVYARRSRQPLGWVGTLHPAIQQRLDLPGAATVVFELALQELTGLKQPSFQELSKFPSVRRDIAVVVDQAVAAGAMCNSVRAAAGPLLQDLQIFDVYQGKHLELGRKSIALGLTLQDFSRTLTDLEVDEVVQAVLRRLHMDYGATLRE